MHCLVQLYKVVEYNRRVSWNTEHAFLILKDSGHKKNN